MIQQLLKASKVHCGHSALSHCVWGSRVSTSLLKRPINYCCRICTILCMVFKKRLFIAALCRPLFKKYPHCSPLFPFENNT